MKTDVAAATRYRFDDLAITEWQLETKVNQTPMYAWQFIHLDGTMPKEFEGAALDDVVAYEQFGTDYTLTFTTFSNVRLGFGDVLEHEGLEFRLLEWTSEHRTRDIIEQRVKMFAHSPEPCGFLNLYKRAA